MKRKIIYLTIAAIAAMPALLRAQNVGINTDNTAPAPSAMLDVKSTSKGLLIPRMTTTERTAIAAPANGLMVYDITTNSFWFFKNTTWTEVTGGLTFPYEGAHGNATVSALKLVNTIGDAIVGHVGGGGNGVAGISATGNGVSGLSSSGPGGLFKSTTGPAVKADGSVDILKNRLRFAGNMANGNAHGIEFSNNAGTSMSHFYGMLNDSISGFYGNNAWRLNFNNTNGNLGLQGNSNPRAPLSFASSAGNKIALYGDGGTEHYGIGIGNGTIQLYGPTTGADVVMGYGSSTNFTERMRVKGTGNVGIGTATPTEKLHVVGSTRTTGTAKADMFTTDAGSYLEEGLNVVGSANVGGNVTATFSVISNQVNTANLKVTGGSPTVGAVLTATNTAGDAAWTNNRIAFNAGISSQPVSNSGNLSFSTGSGYDGVYNDGNGFNNATGKFVAPTNGVYHFDVNIVFDATNGPITGLATSSGSFVVALVKGIDPAKTVICNIKNGDVYNRTLNLSGDLKLVAGDAISVVAFSNVSTTPGTTAEVQWYSTFSGHKVY